MRNMFSEIVVLYGAFLIVCGIDSVSGKASAEELEKRGGKTDITFYCPEGAKSVTVVNLVELHKSKVARSILGQETLVAFIKTNLKRPPWMDEVQYGLLDIVAAKCSTIMTLSCTSLGRPLNVFEGPFDADTARRIAELLEKVARSNGAKLKTSTKPSNTRYTIGDNSVVVFGLNAIAVGNEASITLLCDRVELLPGDHVVGHCDQAVRQLLSDETVFMAWAHDNTKPAVFETLPYELRWTRSQGSLKTQADSIAFSDITEYGTIEGATKYAAELKEDVQNKRLLPEELGLAELNEKVTFERDGSRVTRALVIPNDAILKSVKHVIALLGK